MKNLFLLFVLFLSANLFSQITLTSANNPIPGNTQLNVECDTTGITQGNSGTNQTWNFTNIVRQDSSILSWVAASSTPYAPQFPTANLASTFDNSNYGFNTASSSSLMYNGFAGPSTVVSYSDPQTFLQYPFTYNNSFTDNFAATYMVSGFTINRTGNTNVTCDAWGTINLPIGSFNNSVRIKYIVSIKDSSNPGIPVVVITNINTYLWFVPGKKVPVFEISYVNTTFNGTPQSSSKNVTYVPNSPPIGITQLSSSVANDFELKQNYPNPFNPVTKIRFDIPPDARGETRGVSLIIYDALGKEVETIVNEKLSPGSYEVDWNASGYAAGTYIYRLTANNFEQTRKMILIK